MKARRSHRGAAQTFATELVSLAPDVMVAHGTLALTALHRATRTIPAVFVSVIDPVGAGYVQSLALPGSNITGFSTFEPEIGGKWLELLKEIAPGLSRVAGILDPGFRGLDAGSPVADRCEKSRPELAGASVSDCPVVASLSALSKTAL